MKFYKFPKNGFGLERLAITELNGIKISFSKDIKYPCLYMCKSTVIDNLLYVNFYIDEKTARKLCEIYLPNYSDRANFRDEMIKNKLYKSYKFPENNLGFKYITESNDFIYLFHAKAFHIVIYKTFKIIDVDEDSGKHINKGYE